MADPQTRQPEPTPKTQQTRPKGIDPKTGKPYEPIEIPVPKERDVEDLIERAARRRPLESDDDQE